MGGSLSSLLSVMLVGLWPMSSNAYTTSASALQQLAILPPAEEVRLPEPLSASGVVILHAETGQTLYAKNADVKRPMASLAKLMTALLIIENHELDEWVTIPDGAESVIGNKAYLESGEQFTVGDLLSAILISSANDAAVALAQFHSGSTAAFVDAMNARATQLGLLDTSYANPVGLDDDAQYSTPRDTAGLMTYVLRQPELADRLQLRSERIVSRQGTSLNLYHTHALMHTESGVSAGKTGTTDGAGQCLVSLVNEDDTQYVVVLLRSAKRYADMQAILEVLTPPMV